ncbi:bridge-like lipid transfer protein family member 3B [Ptychodera flava]|uniref:bridge-like lipid transfer protein family member 3B n=1 Tax=Ptychodera flava TaxID=63121 RepID=UPI00396A9B11
MASLIKNQIIKHLSKFVKNLSQDKINLSTLKGEGDLSDLELDEKVLMDLLDLPTWVVLTKAVCNRVHIKIPWTKLKTHPASLYLDQVEVEMEITEQLRQRTEYVPLHSSGGKYGFSDKVIDGLFVVVNAITINFHSKAFQASAQISRFRIRSMRPTWQPADLRLTRIKDMNRGEILIFKEADWLSLRIEVDAIKKDPNRPTTPIRLITNQGKVRFTVKKRLLDCMMLTSKVQLLLEDLLWVLTDSQVKAVIEYCQYLGRLNKQSENQVKTDTNIESQSQLLSQQSKNQSSQGTQQNLSADALAAKKHFDKYDVVESSYHVVMNRVDLHLCDEQNRPESEETFKRRIDGGAMQITLQRLSLDLYPYHIANTSRGHWDRYDEAMAARDGWVEHLMVHFRYLVKCAQDQGKSFKTRHQRQSTDDKGQSREVRGQPKPSQVKGQQQASRSPAKQARLLENTFMIRVEDFCLYSVSTAQSSHKAHSKKFLSSDKKALFLPPDMSSLHIEHTSYYFPDGLDYPVPQSNIFMKLNPVNLFLDYSTILWLYQFANNMATGVKDDHSAPTDFEHRDIRIDALMPKLTLPAEKEINNQPDRPKALQLLSSQLTISNSRLATNSSKSDLGSALQKLYGGKMFYESETFPNADKDLQALPQMFWDHAYKSETKEALGTGKPEENFKKQENGEVPSMREKSPAGHEQNVSEQKSDGREQYDDDKHGSNISDSSQSEQLHAKSFVTYASEDVWCANFEQVWLEFLGAENSKGRPVSLIEAAPLTIWAGLPTNSKTYTRNKSNKRGQRDERPSEGASSKHSKLAIYRMETMHRRKLLKDFYKSESSTESIDSLGSGGTAQETAMANARSMSDSVFVSSRTDLRSNSRDYYSDSKMSSPPPPRQVRQSTSTESIDSSTAGDGVFSSASSTTGLQDEAPNETSREDSNVPDRCILLHSDSKIRLMLNHYQLLFLLRLLDSFSGLVIALEEDYVMFHKQPSPVKSMVISLRLSLAELTLIMPPIPEPEKEEEVKADGNNEDKKGMLQLNVDVQNAGVLSDGAASHDSGLGTPTAETKPDLSAKANVELKSVEEHNPHHGGAMQSQEKLVETRAEKLDLEDEPSTASVESPEEASALEASSETGIAIRENGSIQYRAKPTEGKHDSLVAQGTPAHKTDANPFSGFSVSPQKSDLNPLQALVKRADNIKKSLKNSPLTELLNRSNSQMSLDDTSSVDSGSQWETLSVSSDTSDAFAVLSSDNAKGLQGASGSYVSGDGESEGSFSSESFGTVPVTVVTEDRASSRASTPSVSSSTYAEKKPQMVSVVDLNIEDFQLGIQFDGADSAVKLTVGDFQPVEKGNQELEWFLSKRIAEGGSKSKHPEEASSFDNPVLSVRLTMGPSAEQYCTGGGDRGHLGVDVQGINTQILLSTVSNLLSLIEEELSGDCVPMDINISKANIKLKSDSIPAYPQTTPPDDGPVELYLHSAKVKRSLDGIFHINECQNKGKEESAEESCSSEEMKILREQNRRLKEQLGTTRAALQDVERERSSLFRSLTHMREELIVSDREARELKNQLEKLGTALSRR